MIAFIDTAVRHARNSTILPWAVLGVGILASFLLFAAIQDNVESAAEERFEHQTIEAKRVIEARIGSYADVLYSVRAQFAVHGQVSRVDFQRFVQSLDLENRYPGFEVVNYAAHVRADDKRRFLDNMRATSLESKGYPSFEIKPPGERPDYHVLVYVEPMAGNEFAIGLDVAANPASSDPGAVAAALRSARDSGQLTASGRLIRVMRAKEFVGLAMRLPVYRSEMTLDTVEQRRAAYIGSVGAGFNVENLMKGAISEATSRHLQFRVYDIEPATDRLGVTPPDEWLLFDNSQSVEALQGPAIKGLGSVFTRVLPMEVGGRTWEVHFTAEKEATIDGTDRLFPPIVLVGGLLSSMLLFGVLHSLSRSRSRALKIAAQMTKDLRETSRRVVEVQEAERRLLAQELHDRVGPNLTALGLNLSIVASGLPEGAYPELAVRLEDSSVLVQGTVDAMRDVMAELRPHTLDDYGLPAALRSLATGFSKRTGIQVAFEGDLPGADLPKTVDLAMFRIAQEALNNVAKHSKADRVDIEFKRVNGSALLSVADNGIGFDPRGIGASKPKGGWGLLIMRERAEAVGAQFSLKTEPDAGVQVLVEYGVGTGA